MTDREILNALLQEVYDRVREARRQLCKHPDLPEAIYCSGVATPLLHCAEIIDGEAVCDERAAIMRLLKFVRGLEPACQHLGTVAENADMTSARFSLQRLMHFATECSNNLEKR